MDASATLAWVAPRPPDAQEMRSLSGWAAAHGVRLTPPSTVDAVTVATNPGAPAEVETEIERARDSIAGRDGEGADRAVSRAESLLRAHPELPQAAWLMAEVERARSGRWRHVPPTDRTSADEAWMRAEALDGGRVPGVGEEGTSKHPAPATLTVELSPGDAQAWLDGRPVAREAFETLAGPHALVVTRGGAPVWARWVDSPPGESRVRVVAQTAVPCSVRDVGLARISVDDGRLEAHDVQCPAWLAATAGAQPGGVRVARCERDHCGPAMDWHAQAAWAWLPPPGRQTEPDRGRRWPAWVTWGVLGAGAAIAGGVAIGFATGAFQTAPSETRFVSGGVKRQ
jgi:hypothetical protein